MDQHDSHLHYDRVQLLMQAAKAARIYLEQNPEPLPEHYSPEEPEPLPAPFESGQ
jgi:hypothetical protein